MKEKGKVFSSKRLKNLSALVAARGCKIATELVFFEFLFPIFAFPAVLSNTLYLCISMTSLFAHKVAQPSKWRFLPKNLSQLVFFVIGLAFTWV